MRIFIMITFLLSLMGQDNQAGGQNTVFLENSSAFGTNTPQLPLDKLPQFALGNRIFNTPWVQSPSSVKSFDGLGPLFDRKSCASCHIKDGKGRPPINENEPLRFMLTKSRIFKDGKFIPSPKYGEQLQAQAILGEKKEPQVRVSWQQIKGKYPDGTSYTLRKPLIKLISPTPEKLYLAIRLAPAVFGLGLLEAIDEKTILKYADPNDSDNNDISGRANYTYDRISKKIKLARFGWKAQFVTIKEQIAHAAHQDIGLTNPLFPYENNSPDKKHEFELDLYNKFLNSMEFYLQNTAVPAQRKTKNKDVIKGSKLFVQIGCAKCHIPKHKTSVKYKPAYLANQTIYPYTDLLLHNMGADLAEPFPIKNVSRKEWRTPPLWGLGLHKIVNNHNFFLHDGRARTPEEAILWHGGEAQNARENFMNLSKKERQKLLQFLNSL